MPGALKLASNENPLGPSPLALKALIAAVDSVHLYPDGAALALRDALAPVLGVAADQFFWATGLTKS